MKNAKVKSTKRRFLSSVLSLILCFAMLLGTTWAWFTDSVTSGKNQIVAGNLDVELYHSNAKVTTPENVQDSTDLFKFEKDEATGKYKEVLWEPGVIVYENFTVKNVGNLALKYNLLLDAWDYNTLTKSGTTEAHDLREVIKVAVVDASFSGDREAAQGQQFSTTFKNVEQNYTSLEAGASKEFAVILYWEPTDHDNDYNVNNGQVTSDGAPLYLDVGVRLVATQLDKEKDSFDEKYDEGLTLPGFPAKINTTAINDYYPNAITTLTLTDSEGNKSSVVLGGSEAEPDKLTFTIDNANIDPAKTSETSSITNKISRKITTEEGSGEVVYDISFTFVQQITDGENTTTQTGNITAFSRIVTNELNIGKNLKNVKVTHSHDGVKTPMTVLTSASQDAEGFYYNSNTGWLTIKSKIYSDFIVNYDVPAVKPVKDFEYDPEDKTKLIGLGDFANEKVIKIPEGVKTIANDVFAYDVNVEEIYLSSTVESIGYCTTADQGAGPYNATPFNGCTNLKVLDMSKANMTVIPKIPNASGEVDTLNFTTCDGNNRPLKLEKLILPEKLTIVPLINAGSNFNNIKLYIGANTKTFVANALSNFQHDVYWAIESFDGTNVATVEKPFYINSRLPITVHLLSTYNGEATLTVNNGGTKTGTVNVANDYTPAN